MLNYLSNIKKQQLFVFLFFLSYLLVGVFSYRNYGISLDEPTQRWIGIINMEYINETLFSTPVNSGIPNLHNFVDKDYGPAFEVLLVYLEHKLRLTDSQSIYNMRHLVTFLIYFFGVFAIYKVVKNIYSNYKIGLLAALFIILSPRFFAESFYNNKDIVFMATISICLYTMYKFLEHLDWRWLLLHSFAGAYSADVRIMGMIIIFSTILAILINIIKKDISIKRGMVTILVYMVISWLLIIAMFPLLWEHPIDNIIMVFNDMANFTRWKGYYLFNGNVIWNNQNTPRSYAIVWILITTPIIYSLLMIIGSFKILSQLLKSKTALWSNKIEMYDLIHLALFYTPLLAVIVLSSTLYNGWRQLYFIYPAFILISIKGLVYLYNSLKEKLKLLLIIIVFCSLLWNAYWIYISYPLSNVYFNVLAGKDWKDKWDVDYWGLSNQECLKYILENDNREKISVGAIGTWIDGIASQKLSSNQKSRLITSISDNQNPNYIIMNYRPVETINSEKKLDNYKLIHQIKIRGEVISGIFKYAKNSS